MTKIAVVDKAPSKTSYDIFDFEYDLLHLTDERTGKSKKFIYEGGIKSFVDYLNKNKE